MLNRRRPPSTKIIARFMRPSFSYDAARPGPVPAGNSFPVLVRFLFLVFHVSLFVFLFLIGFVDRLKFQWIGSHNFQVLTALVAAQGVAFVNVFFINVDRALALRTGDHQFPPKQLLLYDKRAAMQLIFQPAAPDAAAWSPGPSLLTEDTQRAATGA